MNWSRYNYLFKSSKYGYLLYNSLSNGFSELDEETYNYLKTLENKENINIEDIKLKESLIEMKVLVENDKDEFYNIKYLNHLNRFYDDYMELTLNPTLHCNFDCSYCFEESKPAKYMTDEVENSLIGFIEKNKKIKQFHITWFGGEPLMAFDRIVSITNRIKEIGINFKAHMITNAYLLTDKVIDMLDDLNINKIQITVDGLAEIHDKRRPLVSGGKTFDKIVSNIDNLKRKKEDFPIVIRVNVDKNNENDFIEVLKFFYKRYNGKIFIAPGFVTGENRCTASDCLMDRNRKNEFFVNLYKQYGVNIMGFYPTLQSLH